MYLQKIDYKTRINTNLLDIIIKDVLTDTGESLLEAVDKMATDTITTKAGLLYDVAPEFAKTGITRNYMIVSLALCIAVYEIYQRIDDNDVPTKVIKNYDDAMEELERIAKGNSPLNLPPRPDDEAPGGGGNGDPVNTDYKGLRRIGTQPVRSHRN